MLTQIACNTHYGHRSKVRVSRQEKTNGSFKGLINNDKNEIVSEEHSIIVSASIDTLAEFTSINKPINKVQPPSQKQFSFKQEKVKYNKKKEVLRDKKPPMNFYAKWALITCIISLLGLVAIVPGALGPVTLYLGRKALKEVNKSGERGKSAAITAIVVGAIITAAISILFLEILFTDLFLAWILLVVILYLLIFLLNLLVYDTIKKSARNPARKNSLDRPMKRQKIGLKIFLIAFLTLLISINIVVLIFLRGAAAG